ncbi:MAG: YgaP family membrane protein [Flavobacterium sp.]
MLNKVFRIIVGTMVLLSVVLTVYVDQAFMWFTVFIGVNLLQSAFTKWCLLETILKKVGLQDEGESCCGIPSATTK